MNIDLSRTFDFMYALVLGAAVVAGVFAGLTSWRLLGSLRALEKVKRQEGKG